jgi:hypothetical protein
MTCDRVQAEISRSLDEDHDLSPEAARHLMICGDCDDFRSDSIRIASGYAAEVRAGIDRLRGVESAPPPRSRRAGLLLAAAAALLLMIASIQSEAPPPRAVSRRPAPEAAGPRPRVLDSLPDLDELGLLVEREPIPVRLNQDFLPTRIDVSEISLPRSLRF